MRENRMLRSTWRELETWFGRELINTGAPVPDPTDERFVAFPIKQKARAKRRSQTLLG